MTSDGSTDSATARRRHEAIVMAIERAGEEIEDRLARFHRSAISKVRPDADLLALGAHGRSAFGHWYEERKDTSPVNQRAFEDLVVLHEALLNHIALLSERAWKDAKVPVEEYDALLEKVQGFAELSRRLIRAFRAAISDLDPLTGAHTRQVMMREVQREVQRSRRAGKPGSLALADIDRFKSINDTHGHAAGDRVLASVSSLLIDNLRPYDSVYRYGGEEFLICLPETGVNEAKRVLDRVREKIASAGIMIESGLALEVTISFGISGMAPRQTVAKLMDRADQALYNAKENGRNRVEIWGESTERKSQ